MSGETDAGDSITTGTISEAPLVSACVSMADSSIDSPADSSEDDPADGSDDGAADGCADDSSDGRAIREGCVEALIVVEDAEY
jgi:hypothetical protein